MQGIIESQPTLRAKAFLSCLYIFGCRVSEALKAQSTDFAFDGEDLSFMITIGKKRKHSVIPIKHVLRVSLNTPFIAYLQDWLTRIEHRRDSRVWPVSRVTAWTWCKKLNGHCSPHFLRHTRLTRLAEKGASAAELMDWAGWSDISPASSYIALTGRLAAKFKDSIE